MRVFLCLELVRSESLLSAGTSQSDQVFACETSRERFSRGCEERPQGRQPTASRPDPRITPHLLLSKGWSYRPPEQTQEEATTATQLRLEAPSWVGRRDKLEAFLDQGQRSQEHSAT